MEKTVKIYGAIKPPKKLTKAECDKLHKNANKGKTKEKKR